MLHHDLIKKGFTLAEVLITLGIIGIVAALTLPSLVSNYRKKVTAAKLKQTYSILSNAIYKQQTLSGIPFSFYYALQYRKDVCPTGYEFTPCSNALFEDYLKDNLSENTIIREEGFLAEFYPDSSSWNYGKAFILSNGVGVNIYNGCLAIIPNYHPPKKVHVKRNNLVIGKDVFWFNSSAGTLSELKDYSGLMPMRKSERSKLTREDLITRCKSNNMDTALIACSQLFIEDGFEFKKDYPIRF